MPDMDGFTAIASLRKNGFENPIIVLTASESPDDKKEGYGTWGVMTMSLKPLEMSGLESAVYKLLEFQ